MEWVKGMGKGEWVKGMDSALGWVVFVGPAAGGAPAPPRVGVWGCLLPAALPGSRPAFITRRLARGRLCGA
jgi:hypothetical protein